MFSWWLPALILTILSAGTVIWVARSDDPWAGIIAFGLSAILAPINLAAWSLSFLLAQVLAFMSS